MGHLFSRSHALRGNALLATLRVATDTAGDFSPGHGLGTQSVPECVPTQSVGTRVHFLVTVAGFGVPFGGGVMYVVNSLANSLSSEAKISPSAGASFDNIWNWA